MVRVAQRRRTRLNHPREGRANPQESLRKEIINSRFLTISGTPTLSGLLVTLLSLKVRRSYPSSPTLRTDSQALTLGYHYQLAPQTSWNHPSPSAQRLPTDAPPLITRPLGGGHPSPVPAPPTYPWSDSSSPPATNYQPYPLPQASSSASTSQQPLPHIDRRASLPRIPTPERAATQPQQRASQIPIFGLSTIGGAIPQGGGGGNSQSAGNNQDEANQSVNPNKGKRMAKPNNAYNIPTVRFSTSLSSSPRLADGI